MDLLIELNKTFDSNSITARVKSQNSIEYKLENYTKNHNNGEGPLNKCFNDIYGIRVIFEDEINFDEIKKFIDLNYPNLKCIDSSKKEYMATHIYFKKDNFSFPWELQIWEKKHEISNINSHEKYKQEYKKWENENKGGRRFGNTLYNNE